MIRKLFKFSCLMIVLVVAAAAVAGYWSWREIQTALTPPAETVIEIPSGRSARAILEQLESAGVIRHALLARLFLVYRMNDASLKAGEYLFEKSATTPEVLERLIRGEVLTHPMTVIEGLTLDETAEALSSAGWGSVEAFLFEMRKVDRIADLDPQALDLEGYLYPDTYLFARGASPEQVVDAMARTFRQHHQKELSSLIGGLDLDLRQLVILASIVERETQSDEEASIVASVYRNRLRIGMGLYADPTIIFALKKLGRWDGNLRKPDLGLDSPYNTYLVPGLPPGPICSPSIQSLLAAAQPAATNYLYFVSRNDGTHAFAETLDEHHRNVEIWQKQYWRARWAAERGRR